MRTERKQGPDDVKFPQLLISCCNKLGMALVWDAHCTVEWKYVQTDEGLNWQAAVFKAD